MGRSANLSCVAQSNPPATITWVRVAEPDSPGSRPSAAASRLVPLDSGERGQWVLVPVAAEAEYRCTAATDDPRLRLATGTVHVLIRGTRFPYIFRIDYAIIDGNVHCTL